MSELKKSKQDLMIKKITLEMEDGTTEEINNGMIVSLKDNGEEATLSIECCNIDGKKYQTIMYGLLTLAAKTYEEE